MRYRSSRRSHGIQSHTPVEADMSNDLKVYVIQLADATGTPHSVRGEYVEQDEFLFASGEEPTIISLKEKISSTYFQNTRTPGRIKVFSSPGVAAASSQRWPSHTNQTEPLEAGKSYGFMDLGPVEAADRIAELEQQNETLSLKCQIYKLQNARIKSTTERLLTSPDDDLSRAYDDGKVVDFWLSPLANNTNNVWPGEWENYETTDSSKKEKTTIQPAINTKFQPNFPSSSRFEMANISSGWNKMTQDATLFLKARARVELTAAAIFEWVGQDESPFPSKRHKAKFVRDCMRLYSRCGGRRQVHGVISDLSRVVAVKLVSVDENMVPTIEKTVILEGESVRTVLSQFAFASPDELSVTTAEWVFGTTRVEARAAIGSGLHGRVFSVASFDNKFVKTFESTEACSMEKQVLDALQERGVTRIPKVEAMSTDGLAFLASPVCRLLHAMQGQAVVWLLGAKFVECLQQAHNANFCHRDVRPSNMGFVSLAESIDDTTEVLLFDWASAAEAGSSITFTGTVHYAASNVLDSLRERVSPVPAPAHDLESLVYAIWDVTRQPTALPAALSVNGSLNSANADRYVTQVQEAWRQDRDQNPALAELLVDARGCNYAELARKMKLKG